MYVRLLLESLKKRLQLYPAVALLGPRQVGKTTLVKMLAAESPDRYQYFDLENGSQRSLFENDLSFVISQFSGQTIILDEIQFLPEVFQEIRSLIDANRQNGRFIFLGFANPSLLRNASESLTGRISFLELQPLLFWELQTPDWKKLWWRGGYPNPFLASADEDVQILNQDILSSYIHRDLPMYGLGTETRITELVFRMLASQHGQMLNTAEIAKSIGRSNPLVVKVLDYLEHSFMVRLLPAWFVNHTKRLQKRPKVYIRNSGLLHVLLGITRSSSLTSHYLCGASYEGFVIEHVASLLPSGVGMYFYRTSHGNELDLVLTRGLEVKVAIEIKLSANPSLSRGNQLALQDLNNPPLLIVCPEAENLEFRPGQFLCDLAGLRQRLAELLA